MGDTRRTDRSTTPLAQATNWCIIASGRVTLWLSLLCQDEATFERARRLADEARHG
jgi:hypothetical protein